MSAIANLFGYILKFLYDIVQNYGVAIILFSILVKLVMVPLTLKQQRTLRKNEKLQEEMKKLQFKYKNDPEKMNQELMALYKKEGISPLSGCFSSIIQIVLLLSVFLLVRSPLTYMVKIDENVIDQLETIVSESGESQSTSYQEIAVIQYVRNLEDTSEEDEDQEENQDEESENSENTETDETTEEFDINEYKDQINLNMEFFGIDLSQVPTQDIGNWKTLIIPLLYVISSIVSIKLSTAMTNKKKENKLITDGKNENPEEVNPMESTNKMMVWMMPILSVSIAIIAPLGLALYWLMNNVLTIIERIVFNKILKKEEEAEENA